MRSTLARSAMPPLLLLCLLLLPPPSLSQDGTDPSGQISPTTIKPTTSSNQDPPPVPTNMALTDKVTSGVSVTTTLPQVQGDSTTVSKGSVVTSVTTQPSPSVMPSKSDDSQSVSSLTTILSSSQDDKPQTTILPSKAPTGDQGTNADATTASSATQKADQTLSPTFPQPTDLVSTSKPPPVLTLASTASPYQPTDSTSKVPESSSEGQYSPATISSTSGPVSSPGFATSTYTPPGVSEETELTSSQMPAGPTPPFSTLPQPTGSSAQTVLTPTTGESSSSSTNLTPSTPQVLSTPSPTPTFESNKIKCYPAIRPDMKLLTLNLTEARLCDGSLPDDPHDKLVSLLCRSVKASFNPAKDQCTVEVAPILESQAVAVKRIVIETKLPPKDVFELLKDKWDELREAGVSDMRFGNEGPPEDLNEDRFSMPLIITIVCMASFLLLVAALYGCCHQRLSQRKDQQRLTEELQTVENGYHDNPTLEVMETSSEMQEKKVVNLNGELGDSWIVPLDNLTKDDLDEEEDTHL